MYEGKTKVFWRHGRVPRPSDLQSEERETMPIPTETVGSLPRPEKLQNAYEDLDQGKITFEDLQELQDEAAKDSIERLEQTGETYVNDGEQRESSFATYPITDTLAGTGLADNLAGDGQFFAIFDDGHHRQLPRLTGGPFRYKTFASEFVEKNKQIATKPVKQAVISPSMMMLLYPLEEEIEGYSREQFLDDVCDEVEKDIRQCFDAGAERVSIDFTEGRLANKNDSRNPWTGKDMLQEFIDLNNRVIDRFSPEERRNMGIHTCPGGDNDSVHSKEVPYEKLLTKMFQLNVGYFLIQCASEEDKETVYKLVGENSRDDANGVPQVCFIGVINPLSPEVETAEEVKDRLVAAAKHIPVERLGATDDCGFSPFSRDLKPAHGSPDFARDIAMQKISNRIEGARMASEELGV
ncbi:cobalamin-independent methionine synthase II family protein [soil metagenome]